jgi:uncharacterized protein
MHLTESILSNTTNTKTNKDIGRSVKLQKDWKVIKTGTSVAALHIPTLQLLTGIEDESGNLNVAAMEDQVAKLPLAKNVSKSNKKEDVLRLNGLILNATENCNLACTYCMVGKGRYHNDHPHRSMNIRDYEDIFNFVFKHYPLGTAFLCFFGGEPMLRQQDIQDAVELFNKMCRNRNIEPPLYSIITNGTLINERMFDFLNDNDIYLSVSIDGFSKFHNSARVFPDGKGSYDSIKKNLDWIGKQKRLFTMNAEATIHKKHMESVQGHEEEGGYSFISTLYSLGFDTVYVFPVDTKDPDLMLDHEMNAVESFYRGVYRYYIELLCEEEMTKYPPGHFVGIFANIMTHRASTSCDSGVRTLFVNPRGEIYPCHLMYNVNYMKLGDLDHGFKNRNETITMMSQISNRQNVEACTLCPNRNLCFLWCAGSSLLSNGYANTVIPVRCRTVNLTIDYAIKEIVRLSRNPYLWEIFKKNIRIATKLYQVRL